MVNVLINTYVTKFPKNVRRNWKQHLEKVFDDGLLNHGELTERAISLKSGVALCRKNTRNIDLVSGKQIKHGLVKSTPSGNRRQAWIGNKTIGSAEVLAVTTDQLCKLQHFFHFPSKDFAKKSKNWWDQEYVNIKGNAFSIYFNKDGTLDKDCFASHYEVNFDELCEIAKIVTKEFEKEQRDKENKKLILLRKKVIESIDKQIKLIHNLKNGITDPKNNTRYWFWHDNETGEVRCHMLYKNKNILPIITEDKYDCMMPGTLKRAEQFFRITKRAVRAGEFDKIFG